jgi:hypothetical protein
MPFSYNAVWDDTVRMFRAHASLITAIAGVFIFLPILLIGHFLPAPRGGGQEALQLFVDYAYSNLHWFLIERLVTMVGTISILMLIFSRTQITVGSAIATGVALLPFYFLTVILTGIMIGLGWIAFLIPGLYLLGRLAPVGVIVVVENRRNPIDAIQQSFAMTKGKGWSILGLLLIVAVTAFVCAATVTIVVGIFLLVIGGSVGRLLTNIVSAGANSVVVVLLILLVAAIYRQLKGANSPAAVFE